MLGVFPSELQFLLVNTILKILKEPGLFHQFLAVLEGLVEISFAFLLIFHHAGYVKLW
jgi:hypothetical protein